MAPVRFVTHENDSAVYKYMSERVETYNFINLTNFFMEFA